MKRGPGAAYGIANCAGLRRNRRSARRPGGQPRRWAAASTRMWHTSSQRARAHAGIAQSVPLILAAAQPPPLINHCCGAAATVHERGRSTAKRRHRCRRLPCCVSRARRRPHPAEPAAVPPRRSHRWQGCQPRSGAQRPCRGGNGVAGSRQVRAGVGSAARDGQRVGEVPHGHVVMPQAMDQRAQRRFSRERYRFFPAQVGFRRTFLRDCNASSAEKHGTIGPNAIGMAGPTDGFMSVRSRIVSAIALLRGRARSHTGPPHSVSARRVCRRPTSNAPPPYGG